MPRFDGRTPESPRPVEMTCGFQRNAEGSVLYRAGKTVVLCTASVDLKVPSWMEGKGKGWVTAEDQMHPRANPDRREARDGRGKAPSGRTQEIQRLVGRALRAAVDMERLGEKQITVDCDVLEAAGGTRTASITGGFVALAIALDGLLKGLVQPGVLREPVAAVSVGYFKSELLVDLVSSRTEGGRRQRRRRAPAVVEVRASRGRTIERAKLIDMPTSLGGTPLANADAAPPRRASTRRAPR